MVEQSKLNVNRWQAARRKWLYTPTLWFYYRMIEAAFLDAHAPTGKPTNEALLARDWIARSETSPAHGNRAFVSFPECCQMLGLNADAERAALLDAIDKAVETDNDEAWARLEELSASEPLDDAEPLFDAPRVVPALDQLALFE